MMAKRMNEPEEAIGPAVNGLDFPMPSFQEPEVAEEAPLEEIQEDDIAEPVALLVGSGDLPAELARLASLCGFAVQAVVPDDVSAAEISWTDVIHIVPDYLDLVSISGIDRDSFICVFTESPQLGEDILAQCLTTDARYIGLDASPETCQEILAALKKNGAPDAELAAIACPMGLNIGAESVPQKAVAIVAELLGAWTGKLKSLRPGLLGLRR